ncbi:siphovirus ReqiPepy6 Gp37-like family protein [Lysinibacillus xylanilyticus]|uniref:siphovirus ReqiPepy6 Gp37-like family protein n=1 Tax=Lysinibacillus xylanilyticus TaxID=582475 RepID=UPI00381F9AC7
MQTIRILTSDFAWLGEIDDYESLIFTRRHAKSGEFELHININKQHTDTLQQGNLVYLASNKVGVIKYREMARDNSETLIIKGPATKSYLSQRLVIPPDYTSHDRKSGNVETVQKHYVDNHAVNPLDQSRKIPLLTIATNRNRGVYISKESRYDQLDELLQSISELTNVGWEIFTDIENNKHIFDIVEGRNLTVNQPQLPPVIFSVDFDNLENAQYIDSEIGHKNVAFVAGQGEGIDRRIIRIGNASGLDLHEMFVDARDIGEAESVEGEEVPIPESEIIAKLNQRGNEKLMEVQKLQTFESEILTYGPFVYEQDWDLGDIVTVQDTKWGITLDTPITEVKEIYEVGGFKLEAVFGNNIPTFVDKVKQVIKQPLTEISATVKAVSQLVNDAGYVTSDQVQQIQKENYVHTQIASASKWTIHHNLGKYPSVTITDSAGSVVMGDVKHTSLNIIELTFSFAFSGKAIFN